jgi:hypothetical protein
MWLWLYVALWFGLISLSCASPAGHEETCSGAMCTITARMAAMAPKVVRKVIPAPRPHWVGNGFHVFPVPAPKCQLETSSSLSVDDFGKRAMFWPLLRPMRHTTLLHNGKVTMRLNP